jgi:hypothetical protein
MEIIAMQGEGEAKLQRRAPSRRFGRTMAKRHSPAGSANRQGETGLYLDFQGKNPEKENGAMLVRAV